MATYASIICQLPLYKELDKSIGRAGLDRGDVDCLTGIVSKTAEEVGPALELIRNTYTQYTQHNIVHCRNVILLMGEIIPRRTLRQLNALEITMLLLSALLHDVGMIVSEREKARTLASDRFRRFSDEHPVHVAAIHDWTQKGQVLRAAAIQDSLLAEFFRRVHTDRVRRYIEEHLSDGLAFQECSLLDDVSSLCESHGWGVRESWDPLDSSKAVCQLPTNAPVSGVPCCMQYLACCLRLADIMDFDRSRSPLSVYRHIDFTEEKSWEEWNKHLSVKGWSVRTREIIYRTKCLNPTFFVAVHHFLDAVDKELHECRYLLDRLPVEDAKRCSLEVPHAVDRRQVQMSDPNAVAGSFKFALEYKEILRLLMDKSLYPDDRLFLRELLQNALDACRHRKALMVERGQASEYEPRIVVWDRSDDSQDPRIVFQDNGTGMSLQIVEGYFLRVGRSYYRSTEFEGLRARLRRAAGFELEACSYFGIGILSCFLVAERFEIQTYKQGFAPLHIRVDGPDKYFLIRLMTTGDAGQQEGLSMASTKDIGPPHEFGTQVTVHLKEGHCIDAYSTLEEFAANVDCDIRVYSGTRRRPKLIRRHRWDKSPAPEIATFSEIGGSKDVAENLAGVVVPSLIPFEQWDFSNHLQGQAWFWLLASDNEGVCWRRGWLEIDECLRPLRVLDVVRKLLRFLWDKTWSNRGEQLFATAAGLLRDAHADSEEHRDISQVLMMLHRRHEKDEAIRLFGDTDVVSALLNHWEKMDRKEHFTRHTWYDWEGAPAALANSDIECLIKYASCTSVNEELLRVFEMTSVLPWRLEERRHRREIALHGVRIPGGVARWQPAAGVAAPVELLHVPGGVYVDAHGPKAPVPAASRLFIVSSEADSLTIPFHRAAIRHAINIVGSRTIEPEFRAWFSHLAFGGWAVPEDSVERQAVLKDLSYLEERIPYVLESDTQQQFLLKKDLAERLSSPWIPDPSSRDPILVDGEGREWRSADGLTSHLMRMCPRRERRGGKKEIYLGS